MKPEVNGKVRRKTYYFRSGLWNDRALAEQAVRTGRASRFRLTVRVVRKISGIITVFPLSAFLRRCTESRIYVAGQGVRARDLLDDITLFSLN